MSNVAGAHLRSLEAGKPVSDVLKAAETDLGFLRRITQTPTVKFEVQALEGLIGELRAKMPNHPRKFLDISTIHLRPETIERLQTDKSLCVAYPHPEGFGWFVWVPTDTNSDKDYYHPDLVACFKVARKEGCEYILFDRDASSHDDLEVYTEEGGDEE